MAHDQLSLYMGLLWLDSSPPLITRNMDLSIGGKFMDEKEKFIEKLDELRSEKDMDKIADLFNSVVIMYGVTVEETCALAYYLIDKALKADHNALMLREKFSIDINTLGLDGKLTIAKAMISNYSGKVKENEQA
ncbi:hypothetical protein D922_01527 [Enterococcus faecalis 06-MB-DW-09]|nr:hypothetical protein D922_01527 [Enterococcus faecalis 06-MB-DW-09]